MAGKRLFLTGFERRKRVEALMKQAGLTWYGLSRKMNRDQISVQRAFMPKKYGTYPDPRISTIVSVAKALGVSAGFFIDREVRR